MQNEMYSILDHLTQTYSQPFACINQQDACRKVIATLKNSPDSLLNTSPQDYTLHRVAVWDDTEGVYFNERDTPLLVAKVSQLKNTLQNEGN